ncbi:hypothetical protein RHGRI_010484 [Rhododendron griersonianum]|uniref:Pentatricopeptide repeat-containing protein n=1 Tax=Rhododendron griersonianum TaxID=479676 RepID=A0AAV6KIQ1_9ERIC|nr:hypothetical protein RHGRI_010484 [Rhododendron griersonianum]
MQLCISNHSRSTFYRFLNPILHIVDKEPKTLAGIGIACFYNHAPHSNHSDVWFVKVVSTLCIQSSTTSLSGFHSDYLRNNLSPSIAFEVIRRLNGYHCNGKLAFDFFQFTRLNLNVTHSIATYNVLLRSLCQMGFHHLAKLVYEYMRVDGHLPDSSLLGLLVSSFAHAGNFDFAKQLLSHAQLDNVEIRSSVYNNFLTLLVRRNRVQEAVSFFRHILKLQCYCPDTCTFNIVIRGLCRVGEVEKAFELFNDMGSFGCSPDVETYNALINGLSRVGEADRGLELLREVQSGNVFSPDVVTYTSVVSAYCKLGNMEMASSIYDEMISSGVKPSLITFNVLIDGFGKSGDMSSARSTYEKMLCCGCLPDVVTFTSLIDGYCRSGKVDQGLKLLDEMNGRNLAPNRLLEVLPLLCFKEELYLQCLASKSYQAERIKFYLSNQLFRNRRTKSMDNKYRQEEEMDKGSEEWNLRCNTIDLKHFSCSCLEPGEIETRTLILLELVKYPSKEVIFDRGLLAKVSLVEQEKLLTDLALVMLDEKETDNGCHDPDKGLRTPNALTILRQYSWGSPLLLIHDRFMDKSKKHERRNSNGLLKEILSDGDMHLSDDRLGALRDDILAI